MMNDARASDGPAESTLTAEKSREHDDSSVESSPPRNAKPPQDTGKAWMRLFAAWLLLFVSWGPALSFGEFASFYETDLLKQTPTTGIAWIGSTSTLLLVTMGSFTGPLFDRGYLKHLLCCGMVLLIFGWMMLSLSTQYYQVLLSQGICTGIGSGLVFVPALAFVNTSFTKFRAGANGLVATGNSLGGIIFPILFRHLQPQIGFPWTIRIIAFMQIGVGIVAGILLYDAPVIKNKPRSLLDTRALKEASFLCMAGVFFCNFLSYWIPIFLIPIYGMSKLGMSRDLSAYMVCITNAGSIPGRVIPAFVAQKVGPMNVVLVFTFLSTILTFSWLAVSTVPGFFAWAAIWGFVTGVFVSVNPVAVTHPVLSPSMDIYGTRLGMVMLMSGVGTLIGEPIAGALANTVTGDFTRAQIFSGAVMLGGFLLAIVPWYEIWKFDRRQRVADKARGRVGA